MNKCCTYTLAILITWAFVSVIIGTTSEKSYYEFVESFITGTKDIVVNNITTTTNDTLEEESKPMCLVVPKHLLGELKFSIQFPSWKEIEEQNQELLPGGRYSPKNCVSRHKVAVIIPFRQRERDLRAFLSHLHPILRRQELSYGIYVIEQAGDVYFNRAMLFNVGFVEANTMTGDFWECYIFHDVDLLPENDNNLYTCPQEPRHMSVAVDKFNYTLPYVGLFGGVSAMNKHDFKLVNGFSNRYWGWGGEDDDMSQRLQYHKLKITRYPNTVARYKMIQHKSQKPNPKRMNLLKEARKYFAKDGLSSLKYKVLNKTETLLYTKITVDLTMPKNV